MEGTARTTLADNVIESEKPFLYDLYFSIFLKALSDMKRGSMRVVLKYEQRTITLGDIESTEDPYFHSSIMYINNPIFFKKLVFQGDIGLAEGYLDGDWDTDNITAVLSWFLLNVENTPSVSGSKKKFYHFDFFNLANKFLHYYRKNTISGSKKNIVEHYDLGNKFYEIFLDKTMTYSAAYFEDLEQSLEEAQISKYDALCRKLKLSKEDHVLEIGSGWGGFSIHAAGKYGCKITTVTISDEQLKYAEEKIQLVGLSHLIDIQHCDYRHINGQFDKIVSIEMLEAVGDKYYETYFAQCNKLLKRNGIMAFQVITTPDSRFEDLKNGVDFIQKHIFPGSLLPSIGRMNTAINKTGDFYMHHLEDRGLDYAKTLKLWLDAFEENLKEVRALGYDEYFIRKWRYYLSYCEAAFRMRNISVVQMVYTRPNNLTV